jgi:hypothetical protein
MTKKLLFAFTLALLSFNILLAQTTVSIPLSQGNGEDAYLASGSPDINLGTRINIGGNTWTCSGNTCLSRGLFKFDFSSLPAGAVITKADLKLYADLDWSATPTTEVQIMQVCY